MRVGSVNAPELVVERGGSVANVQLGEQNARIFRFELEGDDEDDITLRSISFEAD